MSLAELRAEASKCQFCGFCEYACPTYKTMRMRHFGPRGRINLIKNFDGEALRGGVYRHHDMSSMQSLRCAMSSRYKNC